MARLRCGLIGATGIAGQQFVAALAEHPYFELAALAASPRNNGKSYLDALRREDGSSGWYLQGEPHPRIAALQLSAADDLAAKNLDLIFSAVEAEVARALEPRYAEFLPVVSTASTFRYEDDVPLLLPPINASHLAQVRGQSKRGWKGYVLPIPNCTTTGLAMTLAPLHAAFGVRAVMMTSLQAVSGAGRSPGVPAMDVIDNVVPYIPKEEEKVAKETQKILGAPGQPATFKVSSTCMRVAVLDGHTEAVAVGLGQSVSVAQVVDCMRSWRGDRAAENLPSAPPKWLTVSDDPFRPQPRLDRDAHRGMATSVGRVRRDDVLENGIKYVLVSHNAKLGAAQGAILVAELLVERGFVGEGKTLTR